MLKQFPHAERVNQMLSGKVEHTRATSTEPGVLVRVEADRDWWAPQQASIAIGQAGNFLVSNWMFSGRIRRRRIQACIRSRTTLPLISPVVACQAMISRS